MTPTRTHTRSRNFRGISLILFVAIATLVTGCDTAQVAEFREQVIGFEQELQTLKPIKAEAEATIAAAEKDIKTLPPGSARDEAQEILDKAKATLAKVSESIDRLETGIADFNTRIEKAENGLEVAGAAIQSAAKSGAVSPPYDVIAALSGGLLLSLGTWWKQRGKRIDAEQRLDAESERHDAAEAHVKSLRQDIDGFGMLVQGIELAKDAEGKVNFKDPTTRQLLKSLVPGDVQYKIQQKRSVVKAFAPENEPAAEAV